MDHKPELVLEVEGASVLPAPEGSDGGDLSFNRLKLSLPVFPFFRDGPDVSRVTVQQFKDVVISVLAFGEKDEAESWGEDVAEFGLSIVQCPGQELQLAGVADLSVAQDFGQQVVTVVGQGSFTKFIVVQAGEYILGGKK